MPDGSPEIFHTLQGEGRNVGTPSVFIRASLCNLHCVWCDTAYTWNWEDTNFSHENDRKFRREEQIVELSSNEICEFVEPFPCNNFVFTGGEPLLQEKAWVELMDALLAANPGSTFEVETNGTLFPGAAFLERVHQFNVSPKLCNSGVEESRRYFPDVIRSLRDTGKVDFKFVVGDQEDLDEVLRFVGDCEIPTQNIFLMPRALTVAELEKNQSFAAEAAQSKGFKYSDRLHLRLYGAKRGV